MKRLAAIFLLAAVIFSVPVVNAQSASDDLSPQTQQYIDNLNEVKEAQNDGRTDSTAASADNEKGTSAWTYVFYGAVSGAAYGFWRWLKKLRNNS